MNRREAARLIATLSAVPLVRARAAQALTIQRGQGEGPHPRIAAAIRSIEDAVNYLEHAPHDFGGHRAAAVEASRAAIAQLRLCQAYKPGR
ncbi:MAG TPA: hypothetical protein VGI92_05955 [Gemmatimonadales bacterium]|jgi:hypothetical protein